MDFTRINNDVNGNPRYVVHFLELINKTDKVEAERIAKERGNFTFPISVEYEIAVNKARKIGGRKFNNKQYGGGIVFQSYSTKELESLITEAKG